MGGHNNNRESEDHERIKVKGNINMTTRQEVMPIMDYRKQYFRETDRQTDCQWT